MNAHILTFVYRFHVYNLNFVFISTGGRRVRERDMCEGLLLGVWIKDKSGHF